MSPWLLHLIQATTIFFKRTDRQTHTGGCGYGQSMHHQTDPYADGAWNIPQGKHSTCQGM